MLLIGSIIVAMAAVYLIHALIVDARWANLVAIVVGLLLMLIAGSGFITVSAGG